MKHGKITIQEAQTERTLHYTERRYFTLADDERLLHVFQRF